MIASIELVDLAAVTTAGPSGLRLGAAIILFGLLVLILVEDHRYRRSLSTPNKPLAVLRHLAVLRPLADEYRRPAP